MRRHSSDIFALGAIAIFALVLFSINDSWMFVELERLGLIDPYIYRGFFMNLSEHLKAFDGLYYTSRLPPILIGAAFQNLPDSIGIVLMRLLYAGTSAVSIYIAVSRLTDNKLAAVATVILLLTDTYFLTAVGSDYVNGAAFTFLSIGMASLIAASSLTGQRRWLLLVLSGAALSTAVATHILSLMPAAFLCLLFILLSKDQRGLGRLLRLSLPMAIGAIFVIVVFGLASLFFGGKFLFFLPQFLFAPGVAATWMPMNRPAGPGFVMDWVWSWPHLLVTVISISVLAGWKAPRDAWTSRVRSVLVVQCVFVGLCFALDLAGLGIFMSTYNYVYPEVLTILAVGALFGIAFRHESTRHQLIATTGMALVSIGVWLSLRLGFNPCSDSSCMRHEQAVGGAIALAGLLLVAATALARNGLQRVATISATAAAWAMLSVALSKANTFDVRGGEEARRSFLGFLAFSRKVSEFASPDAKYWFDARSDTARSDEQGKRLVRVFNAQASIWLYGYRMVGDAFPNLAHPFSGKIELLDNDTIVALSAACSPPELAEKALDAAGYQIKARTRQSFDLNGRSVCGDRMKIAARLEPLGPAIDRVALSAIKSDPGGEAAFAAGALKATTLACQYCYSLRIPMPKPTRTAVARIRIKVESGSVGIGLSRSTDLTQLHEEKVLKAQPYDQTVDLKVDPRIDADLIILRNFEAAGASRLTLESIVLHDTDRRP
jgi:hypothetical protein